ncbi:MAG TPA: ferritin-like domain-containing protein [Rubrobacteraceae bacterium]|nr:ferritin-like domain-containing protein [Rubrobacteraceae bacterium]
MDKHTINVPGVEAFAQPQSRKNFFKALAFAAAGTAVGSTVLTRKAYAQSGNGDVDIANFALTLEYLEAEFYANAVDAGVLSGDAAGVVKNLADHEQQHVDAITGLLKSAGAKPVAKPKFTFPADAFSSQDSILNLAATFEPVGVGAYLGAATMIQSPDILAAAGSIAGVEGEHVVAVNNLLGVVPPANQAMPASLTKDEVLAAVAPFLGMGGMMDTGGVEYRDRNSFGRV